MIEVNDLQKSFNGHQVLRGVSFRLPRGVRFVIMGGSGAGKTVCLRLIAGLIRPDSGQVRVFGKSIERLSEEALLPVRRRMGYVFQGAALFDSLTVRDNVAYSLHEHTNLDAQTIAARVRHLLSLVGLDEGVQDKLPAELSGGMRKRVGIARALAIDPEVMLFDEPTAGLDPTNSKMVADLVAKLGTGVCDTAVVVTHDIELANAVADQMAILIDGQFAATGTPEEVHSSRDPGVQAFLRGEAR
ncbi:MAG: ABC transporter ATP-binding protein [Candidatus Rokuibacteriota bacterium]|nr:MAG: ABC transporter ATP-binding protein [Candidatus Rokubacteria bacterium]